MDSRAVLLCYSYCIALDVLMLFIAKATAQADLSELSCTDSRCYYTNLHLTVNWTAAVQLCRDEGMVLAAPDTAPEIQQLQQLIQSRNESADFWLGGRQDFYNSPQWLNRTEVDPALIAPVLQGVPYDWCGTYYAENHRLTYVQCFDGTVRFICQHNGDFNINDDVDILYQHGNHVVPNVRIPWYTARTYCESRGWSLSVTLPEEELFIEGGGDEMYWMGFASHQWVWEYTGEEIHVTNWARYRPISSLGNCLMMEAGGEWEDSVCQQHANVLCQTDLQSEHITQFDENQVTRNSAVDDRTTTSDVVYTSPTATIAQDSYTSAGIQASPSATTVQDDAKENDVKLSTLFQDNNNNNNEPVTESNARPNSAITSDDVTLNENQVSHINAGQVTTSANVAAVRKSKDKSWTTEIIILCVACVFVIAVVVLLCVLCCRGNKKERRLTKHSSLQHDLFYFGSDNDHCSSTTPTISPTLTPVTPTVPLTAGSSADTATLPTRAYHHHHTATHTDTMETPTYITTPITHTTLTEQHMVRSSLYDEHLPEHTYTPDLYTGTACMVRTGNGNSATTEAGNGRGSSGSELQDSGSSLEDLYAKPHRSKNRRVHRRDVTESVVMNDNVMYMSRRGQQGHV